MASSTAPIRLTTKDWIGFISRIVLVIGALLAAGNHIVQVKGNTRRIEVLKTLDKQHDVERGGDKEKLNAIDIRTARIASKLEILLPPSKGTKP